MKPVPKEIAFGWGAEPLAEQLDGLVDTAALGHFQLDGDAIIRLHMRSIISDGERDRAIKRLTKQIGEAIVWARVPA